jgi:hypothetical protein
LLAVLASRFRALQTRRHEMTQFTNNKTAPLGHNSRAYDVERTATELRGKYIRDFVHEGTPFKWCVLTYANASDMSSDAFRNLFSILSYADENGENAYASNETMARLTGRSLSTIKRSNSELQKDGWRITTKRRQNDSAIVKVALPQKAIDAILFEILEPSPVTVPDLGSVTREPSKPLEVSPVSLPGALEGSPVTLREFGRLTRDPLTIVVGEEEVKHTGSATEGQLDWKEQAQVECSSSVALNGHAQARLTEGPQLQGVELNLARSSSSNQPNGARVYNQSEIAYTTQGGEPKLCTSADLFGGKLPSREHLELWHRIVTRWGRSPAANIKEKKVNFSVGQWLKNDVKNLGRGHSHETILSALDITLGSMEACTLDEPTEAAKPGAKPAKNYFAKQFAGTLQRLRADEHAERVEAQKRQALAEIEIEGAKAANGKKLAALDSRIQMGNDAATKRIAATGANGYSNGHANGKAAAPAQPDRFRDDDKKVADICGHWVDGPAAQAILEECPGATPKDVRTALREISNKFRKDDGRPQGIGDRKVVSAKRIHEAAVAYWQMLERVRLDAEMKAEFGEPEEQLADGHTLHPAFKSEWLCLSREFVAALEQKCPLLKAAEKQGWVLDRQCGFIGALRDAFSDLAGDSEHLGRLHTKHGNYGNGLQQRAEAHIEKALLELEAKWRERAEQAAKEEAFRQSFARDDAERRVVNRGI